MFMFNEKCLNKTFNAMKPEDCVKVCYLKVCRLSLNTQGRDETSICTILPPEINKLLNKTLIVSQTEGQWRKNLGHNTLTHKFAYKKATTPN